MDATLAARLGDQVGSHSGAFTGLLAGIAVGLAVGVAIALTIGTGGLAGPALVGAYVAMAGGAVSLGAVGGMAGAKFGGTFKSSSPCGGVSTGSPTVFIEGPKAARQGVDTAKHGAKKIAQGSATVFVNGRMLARDQDGVECGGKIVSHASHVYVGGPRGGHAASELPGWAKWLPAIALGGCVVAFLGGALAVGVVASTVMLGASLVGGAVGKAALGAVGRGIDSLGGRTDGRWGDLRGTVGETAGSLVGGIKSARGAMRASEWLGGRFPALNRPLVTRGAGEPLVAKLAPGRPDDACPTCAKTPGDKPVTDLTPEELAASPAEQARLFRSARDLQARMQALADGIRAKLGLPETTRSGRPTAKSLLKRESEADFLRGVKEKTARKGYERIGQMDDMVRGRFNAPDRASVEKIVGELRGSGYEVQEIVAPRTSNGVETYSRYHVILRDAETGLTHEWQVGTDATTSLYEDQGIKVPDSLAQARDAAGKHFNDDLHDVYYDLFKSVNQKYPDLGERYGLPDFIGQVESAAPRAGQGEAVDVDALHQQASDILARMNEEQGSSWVLGFFH
jgi:uncharacterized Zn-binding protein involved in type VI secretion